MNKYLIEEAQARYILQVMEDCPGKWSHPVIKIFESLKRVEQPAVREESKPKKEEIKPKKDANVPKDKHK